MKDNGLLSNIEHSVVRLQRLNLTEFQQCDAIIYEPGLIVEFHRRAREFRKGLKEKRFKSGEQWRFFGAKREP
jgi:hypothetical protein